jgi:tRNA pseudouridine55 synthase
MVTELKSGFLLINKPTGITSYGCIGYLKRIIRQKIKIGHAGTLDPFASGLLIVAIGREATRLMSQVMALEKTYTATAKLGELTDTLDYTGAIVETMDYSAITKEKMYEALVSFGSSYEQTPPFYSALKHEGDPLYKLARQGSVSPQDLEIITHSKRKTVQLYELQLVSFDSPFFAIKARVSQGTYIRSLVNDIAVRLGSCATTYTLERSAIGQFSLEKASLLTEIHTVDDINSRLIPIEDIDSFLNSFL